MDNSPIEQPQMVWFKAIAAKAAAMYSTQNAAELSVGEGGTARASWRDGGRKWGWKTNTLGNMEGLRREMESFSDMVAE